MPAGRLSTNTLVAIPTASLRLIPYSVEEVVATYMLEKSYPRAFSWANSGSYWNADSDMI